MQASVVKRRISTECICLPPYEFAPSGESLLLCGNGQLHTHTIVEIFLKKKAHYVSGLSV